MLRKSHYKSSLVKFGVLCAGVTLSSLAVSKLSWAVSLEEIVKTVIDEHPAIHEARQTHRATAIEIDQAKGGKLPIVNVALSTGLEGTDSRATQAIGEDDEVHKNRTDAQISVVLPLYDAGLTQAETTVATTRTASTAARVDNTSQEVVLRAIRAYFRVLNAEDALVINRQAKDAFDYHMKTENKKLKGGFGNIADFEQSTSRYALASTRVVAARADLDNAIADYKEAVGSLPKNLDFPSLPNESYFTSLEEALTVARQNHPVLSILANDIGTAGGEIEVARSALYPKLNIEADALATHDANGFDASEHDYRLQLVMRWNVFNGNRDKHRLDRAAVLKEATKQAFSTAQRDVERELRNTIASLQSNLSRQAELERRVHSATRVQSAYKKERTLGTRSSLDLLTAETDLLNAKLDLTNVKHSAGFDRFRVMAAAGNLLSYFQQ